MCVRDFTPFIIQNCLNISESIQKQCQAKRIRVSDVDFRVKSFRTFIRPESGEPRLLTQEEAMRLNNDVRFNEEGFDVFQTYTIEVMPKFESQLLDVEVSESADEVFLVIEKDFTFIKHPFFIQTLYNTIESKMAYHGVILRQISELRKKIQEVLAQIAKEPLNERTKFSIKKSIFTPYKKSRLELLLLEKWEKKNNTKAPVDSAFGVLENECIGILHLANAGKSGRNLKGKYIENEESDPEIGNQIAFSQEEIVPKAYGDKIEYFSKMKGYVGFDGDRFYFWQNPNEALKTTNSPSLLGGIDLGFALNIKAEELTEDAIGENIQVEADEISISGCIGKDAIVRANKLKLDGSTHKDAKVFAKISQIHTHKGFLESEKCVIENLDSGVIEANMVKITHANGGQIYARQAQIQNLKSNNKIFISNHLHIQTNKGFSNEFTICIDNKQMQYPKSKQILIENQNEKLQSLLILLKDLAKQNQKYEPFMRKMKEFSNDQKRLFLSDKERLEKYQMGEYYGFALDYLKKYIIEVQKRIAKAKDEILAMQDDLKDAKITTDSIWDHDNYAILKSNNPYAMDKINIAPGVIQNIGVSGSKTRLKIF